MLACISSIVYFRCGSDNHPGRVDHAWPGEPAVEFVAAVVVALDTALVACVRAGEEPGEDPGEDGQEYVADEVGCDGEAGEVVAVFEDVEKVAFGDGGAVEVSVYEGPHGNLSVATVVNAVCWLSEGDVVVDRKVWKLGLIVVDPVGCAGEYPEHYDQQWHKGEDTGDGCHCETAYEAR